MAKKPFRLEYPNQSSQILFAYARSYIQGGFTLEQFEKQFRPEYLSHATGAYMLAEEIHDEFCKMLTSDARPGGKLFAERTPVTL